MTKHKDNKFPRSEIWRQRSVHNINKKLLRSVRKTFQLLKSETKIDGSKNKCYLNYEYIYKYCFY